MMSEKSASKCPKSVLIMNGSKRVPEERSRLEGSSNGEISLEVEVPKEADSNHTGGVYSDQHNIDAECEKLLRNTKKQVKQMMEEAVTRKFIHEESSTIISLCVAIDACLSHGLKRRALGLFKTSSSGALVQKAAKSCPEAQQILELVGQEERRVLSEQQEFAKRSSLSALQQEPPQRLSKSYNQSLALKSPVLRQASNLNVHKRNLWIKCALIEKKLVPVVEYLAREAGKYYEPEALMSNYLCAQIFASLLVGPSALEFSRSKESEWQLFEDPTAEELLKRHKLSNPIACLCGQQSSWPANCSAESAFERTRGEHNRLSRSITEGTNKADSALREVNNSLRISSSSSEVRADQEPAEEESGKRSTTSPRQSLRVERRRRPLALKTSVKRGTILTDCHHYDCQELSEHHCTGGYSFLCTSSAPLPPSADDEASGRKHELERKSTASTGSVSSFNGQQQADCWSLWSPRMLHETLHQNSRSSLLYAKNNVLLESQPQHFMPGYLSLHQTSQEDLVLKWIPNQMINGGQAQPDHRCSSNSETFTCENCLDGLSSSREPPAAGRLNWMFSDEDSSFALLNSHEGGLPDEPKSLAQPVAVESSFLKYVVHLPVSRIVLLHCQFAAPRGSSAGEVAEAIRQAAENGLTSLQQYTGAAGKNCEETLILVETDGVQRAPFKFPKGGLRLFLSCLQSGLQHSAKYLEPAIKFDEDSCSTDPLAFELDPATSESPGSAGSRLECFLRRLPSLKRKRSSLPRQPVVTSLSRSSIESTSEAEAQPSASKSCSLNSDLPANSGEQQVLRRGSDSLQFLSIDSRASSESRYSRQSTNILQQHPPSSTNNYVYRILSLQQAEWPLQTPPHSALSVGSSSSSQQSQSGARQRFRWSLARLTKLSAIYTRSQSSSSSSLHKPVKSHDRGLSGAAGSSPRVPFGPAGPETAALNSDRALSQGPASSSISSCDLARIEDKLSQLNKSTSSDLSALRTKSITTLCESMREQILARAFYGWLAHCRKLKIIRSHLLKLVKVVGEEPAEEHGAVPMSTEIWLRLLEQSRASEVTEDELTLKVNQLVYLGGLENDELRRKVWPYLLGHYKFLDSEDDRRRMDKLVRETYESNRRDWLNVEQVVRQRDDEILAANMARANRREQARNGAAPEDAEAADQDQDPEYLLNLGDDTSDSTPTGDDSKDYNNNHRDKDSPQASPPMVRTRKRRHRLESTGSVSSNASITEQFGNNLHRIDKDVQRCDRNFWYFKQQKNLDKLRNIMCSYVWQHLDVGYVQGMCDLAAPFLVIFDDELLAFSCFSQLMRRMVQNFPHGNAMDQHFESLKYLMQVLDPKLFQVFQSNGDYTHFYFCYRWLLLDFKRELVYSDVYKVWETIWSARIAQSEQFVVFMALAMVRYYRDIIIENNMDFTDTIKFFNEMAEKHKVHEILKLARNSLGELKELIRVAT